MKLVETIEQVRALVAEARRGGKRVGLVPTMGALHEGHFSLIGAARGACGLVVVSIFVNPTQFAPSEDLQRYPRTPQKDCEGCRRHGADVVFMPQVQTMYPPSSTTLVQVPGVSDLLCGASRPGHFQGVATVVAKLFNIVQPDEAFFGAKDFQQTVVIKRMVEDLNFPVKITVCPTVRCADGLAMSSRNSYLSPDQRVQAPALHQALLAARDMVRGSRPPASQVRQAMIDLLARRAGLGQVEYVQIVDPQSLMDVESTLCPVLAALAVRFGATRLIDNMLLDPDAAEA